MNEINRPLLIQVANQIKSNQMVNFVLQHKCWIKIQETLLNTYTNANAEVPLVWLDHGLLTVPCCLLASGQSLSLVPSLP